MSAMRHDALADVGVVDRQAGLFERSVVPQVRFGGFSGEWERVKFSQILKMHSFRQYVKEPTEDGQYSVIQQGDTAIVGYADGTPFENYKDVILFGDHTVSLYKPTEPFFVSTDGVKIMSADGFDGDYLFVTIQRYKPSPQGYKRHSTILKNETLWYTSDTKEQQKIGQFFKQLDDTITLQQRELELLKQSKQGFLQKLFPKKGTTRPELRFAGFDDEWEERKLGDVVHIRRGLTYKPSDVSSDGVRVLRSSNITEDVFSIKDDDVFVNVNSINIPFVKNGDILVTAANGSTRLVGKHAIVSDTDQLTVHGGFMLVIEAENNTFINAWMSSHEYKKVLQSVQGGNGAIGNLSKSVLDNGSISMPSQPEQQQIGQFFHQLDQTIHHQEQQLAQLKLAKESFLQKMFV